LKNEDGESDQGKSLVVLSTDHSRVNFSTTIVFFTAFQLRGVDLPFFPAGKICLTKQIYQKIFWVKKFYY
jgi:hypothetical protein